MQALEPHRATHQARGHGFLVPGPRSRALLASRELIAYGASRHPVPVVGYPDEGADQPYRRSIAAGPVPWHLDYGQPRGDIIQMRPAIPVVTVPTVAVRGYQGETWLRMRPFISTPHPSGLPDDFPLAMDDEAERDER
jgi:hypothetical protein